MNKEVVKDADVQHAIVDLSRRHAIVTLRLICAAMKVGNDRVVDRALQRLRKAGVIRYSGVMGWTTLPVREEGR